MMGTSPRYFQVKEIEFCFGDHIRVSDMVSMIGVGHGDHSKISLDHHVGCVYGYAGRWFIAKLD